MATPNAAVTVVETPDTFVEVLWEGDYRYRVLYGGRGSAKSWQVARRLIIKAHEREIRGLCTREFQSSIRDSVHHLLKSQITALALDRFFKVRDNSIRHRNGSEFLFKGLRHDVDEIKSTEAIDVAWVEEGQSMSQRSWDVLIPTIRREGSEIWVTYNPNLLSDPTHQMFAVNPPATAIVRKVTYRDNPWFPEVLRLELEAKRRADPEGFAHIWEGETWVRSKEQVLDGKWMVAEFTPAPEWHGPYFGLDFGFSADPTVLVKCWIYDRRLYLEYDANNREVGNDDLVNLFAEVPGFESHTIRADSARPETINHLRTKARLASWPEGRIGLDVVPVDKWPGSVEDGVTHLRSYDMIVIHPRCELAQGEARTWRYKVDRLTGDVLRQLIDANNNVWDAVRYALAPLIRVRPAPRFGIVGSKVGEVVGRGPG